MLQPGQGLVQCLVILGEVHPNEVVYRLPEEAGAGHGAHAHLPGQVLAELEVAAVAVLADVRNGKG